MKQKFKFLPKGWAWLWIAGLMIVTGLVWSIQSKFLLAFIFFSLATYSVHKALGGK